MHTVTSFRASALDADRTAVVMHDYLALERARVNRRLCVRGFGLLACVIAIMGWAAHRGPSDTSLLSAGLCVLAPVWTRIQEYRCAARLARRLKSVPGARHSQLPLA